MISWAEHIDDLTMMTQHGMTMEEIGRHFDVTRQRIYQIFTKFGIDTPEKQRKSFLKDKEPKYYWLNNILTQKAIPKVERLEILEKLDVPDECPILGMELNYDGYGQSSFFRADYSPSLDRIDSSKGYTLDNIHIISWRANRIKNDATPEELVKIANYIQKIT